MLNTVVDSSAVLSLLFGEPSAELVENIFAEAAEAQREVYISAVNWTEVLYRVQQIQGTTGVKAAKQFEHETPLNVKQVDRELAELAAQLKVMYKLSLGDAYCAALGKQMKATVVTGDLEFEPLKEHFNNIIWFSKK